MTKKLDCGCDLQFVAGAVDATGMELHQQECGLTTGYGVCVDCGHLQPEHDDKGCQHDMGEDWRDYDDSPRVLCGCVRTTGNADMVVSVGTAHDGQQCATCKGIIEHGRCHCWALLADALQQYAGYDYDTAADYAATIWEGSSDAQQRVWKGTWLEDHVASPASPEGIVAALARAEVPGDSEHGDCLLCDAPGGGGYYLHLTTCQGHADPAHAACIASTDKTLPRRRIEIPDISLPSSHRPSCPWRLAKEWAAR